MSLYLIVSVDCIASDHTVFIILYSAIFAASMSINIQYSVDTDAIWFRLAAATSVTGAACLASFSPEHKTTTLDNASNTHDQINGHFLHADLHCCAAAAADIRDHVPPPKS